MSVKNIVNLYRQWQARIRCNLTGTIKDERIINIQFKIKCLENAKGVNTMFNNFIHTCVLLDIH